MIDKSVFKVSTTAHRITYMTVILLYHLGIVCEGTFVTTITGFFHHEKIFV